MEWLALVLALTVNAPEPQPCVTLRVRNHTVEAALRELAAQTKRNIALDPRVRRRVTIDVECVPLEIAMQQLVAQLGASYCDDGRTITIGPGTGTCPPQWSSPAMERVSSSFSRFCSSPPAPKPRRTS